MNELARESAWIRSPEAELARARRDGTALSIEFFAKVKARTVLAAAGLALLGYTAWLAAHPDFPGAIIGLGVFAFAFSAVPLVRYGESLKHEARLSEREIESEFWPHAGHLVELIVRQGDAPTGEDTGMLWFEDGRLYFSGHRTSFGLVPSQVHGVPAIRDSVAGVRNPIELTLERRTSAGSLKASFRVWKADGGRSEWEQAALMSQIEDWLRGPSEGEGQWPPTSIGPRVVSVARLCVEATAWTLIPCVLLNVAIARFVPSWTWSWFAVSLAAFASSVPAANLRWRAIRDRRRLQERA